MGVYFRLQTPTQTDADIEMQIESREIWGKATQNFYQSDIPKVKAYVGNIPPGKYGVEFTTDVTPDPNTPPHLATWSGDRDGVRTERTRMRSSRLAAVCACGRCVTLN